jgi:hypothetical protein
MWWTLLSSCVVLALVLESRRRLLAVRALWEVAAPFLGETRSPRRVSPDAEEVPNAGMPIWAGFAEPLTRAAGAGETGTELGHEGLDTQRVRPRPSENAQREYVAELNEATLEIGAGLARSGGVPLRCAKAALSLGALVALLDAAELVRGDGSRPWLAPALSFLGGCVGALGCALIGRSADAEARRLRADWATLIRRSARDVPS